MKEATMDDITFAQIYHRTEKARLYKTVQKAIEYRCWKDKNKADSLCIVNLNAHFCEIIYKYIYIYMVVAAFELGFC